MRLVRYSYPSYRTPSAVSYGFSRSPWTGLESEIERLFEASARQASATTFPVDLYQDDASTYIRAELPGVSRDAIKVEIAEGVLTLSAERKSPVQAEGDTAPTAALSRAITVGDTVQADAISAAYENGVLTVTLPKREEIKPKKITVAVK